MYAPREPFTVTLLLAVEGHGFNGGQPDDADAARDAVLLPAPGLRGLKDEA